MVKLSESILSMLIENKEKEFNIREISLALHKDYKNTYLAVKSIKDSVESKKKGKSTYISFRSVLTDKIFKVEYMRNQNISATIPLLCKDLDSIENPFLVAVLFGSYAKGTYRKNSDIDLCIIYDNEDEAKVVQRKLSVHPRIELHLFHYSEFIRMLDSKRFNVAHEIAGHGIVLKNIESFYGLLRWMKQV